MGNSVGGVSRYAGNANQPQNQTFLKDPSLYKGFDTSKLATRALAGIGEDIGNEQARTLARASQMGGGRSAGVNRQLADVAALGENRAADVRNQMASKSFDQQLQQLAAANQFNLTQQGLQQQQYATEQALAADERASRRDALTKAFGPLGGIANLFGNY